MTEINEKLPARRAFALYLAIFLALMLAAVLAAKKITPELPLGDAFAFVTSPRDVITATAKLNLTILAEFLLLFIFAFSPLSLPLCFCALAERSFRIALLLKAVQITDAAAVIASVLYILAAVALVMFGAWAAALSPRLRTIRFSAFDGRREALLLSIRFLSLSGAASLLMLGAALILHFA